MSLIIEKFLMCDCCGETSGVDTRSYDAKMQRDLSKKEGWVQRGSKDYCENCKSQTSEHINHTLL